MGEWLCELLISSWRLNKHLLNNSEYKMDSPFFDKSNKKVIGKFKDEASGIPIKECVGLRSKMYSYLTDNDYNGKTVKESNKTHNKETNQPKKLQRYLNE